MTEKIFYKAQQKCTGWARNKSPTLEDFKMPSVAPNKIEVEQRIIQIMSLIFIKKNTKIENTKFYR